MQVVILAAGGGRRFAEVGYKDPKPLIHARGIPMINYALRAAYTVTQHPIVVCSESIRLEVASLIPTIASIVSVRHLQSGAAMSLLAAAGVLREEDSVLTMDCDSIIVPQRLKTFATWSQAAFEATHSSTLLTFTPPNDSDRYSFVRMSQTPSSDFPEVVTVAEKIRISNVATCGVHAFYSWSLLRGAICRMVDRKDTTNFEFYMAPIHRHMPGPITAMHTEPGEFTCIGTPEELQAYEAQTTA